MSAVGQYLRQFGVDASFTGMQTPEDWAGVIPSDGRLPRVVAGLADPERGQIGIAQARLHQLDTLWAAVPEEIRRDILNEVAELIGQAQAASGLLLSAAPWANALVQIGLFIAQLYQGYAEKQRKKAEANLRRARLRFWEEVSNLDPTEWWGRSWLAPGYQRTRPFPEKSVWPRIYPPGPTSREKGPLEWQVQPQKLRSGCEGGAGAFAGGSGTCNGAFKIFPALYPVYHYAAVGPDTTAAAGIDEDMESIILAMQASALSTPEVNLSTDGRRVRGMWLHMLRFARQRWEWSGVVRYINAPKPKGAWLKLPPECGPGECRIHGARWVAIDREFSLEESFREGYYWTPDGLIGAYTGGSGSTTEASLTRLVLRTASWTSSSRSGYAPGELHPFGGNWFSAADWNVVRTAYASFFTYRGVILRQRVLMKELVAEGMASEHESTASKPRKVARVEGDGKIYEHSLRGKFWVVPEPRVRQIMKDMAKPQVISKLGEPEVEAEPERPEIPGGPPKSVPGGGEGAGVAVAALPLALGIFLR